MHKYEVAEEQQDSSEYNPRPHVVDEPLLLLNIPQALPELLLGFVFASTHDRPHFCYAVVMFRHTNGTQKHLYSQHIENKGVLCRQQN
jgi:hypothetical protein